VMICPWCSHYDRMMFPCHSHGHFMVLHNCSPMMLI
jgi:hypothetical protein